MLFLKKLHWERGWTETLTGFVASVFQKIAGFKFTPLHKTTFHLKQICSLHSPPYFLLACQLRNDKLKHIYVSKT